MTNTSYRPPTPPLVRPITMEDLRAALIAGIADFKALPQFGLVIGILYAFAGIAMMAGVTGAAPVWAIIPLALGFPLIGPFVAVGFYEVSRARAAGRKVTWREVLGVMAAQQRRELVWMAMVMLFVFWIWIYQVRLLLALWLGFAAFSDPASFANIIFTTPAGVGFLINGTLVGGLIALILFSLTVISIPMLLDQERDVVTAMIASVRSVTRAPRPMLTWAAIVGMSLTVAMLPAFLGLPLVLPVLGHTTWHLYTRITGPQADGF